MITEPAKMPVFKSERTRSDTTGTLIAFPRELDVNDLVECRALPSGYLSVMGLFIMLFCLGEILGTGDGCAFKQPNVELV